jgi:hypothetical protein
VSGAAFERVRSALTTCSRDLRQVGDKLVVSCPGPGHWRGDRHPSMTVTNGDGRVLIHCHAGCHPEDILSALGLTLGDLYDEPRQLAARPTRNQLRNAIGRARGFAHADRFLYLWLLWQSDWDTADLPPAFQPKSQRDLAAACGMPRMTLQQSVAHLAHHHWLDLACGTPDCEKAGPHAGRGHRTVYGFPGIGEDCPGRSCRLRCRPQKAALRGHLRVVGGTGSEVSQRLGLAPGSADPPPTTFHDAKTASDLGCSAQSAAFYLVLMQPFTRAAS